MASCSTSRYVIVGNVSLLDGNGDVMRRYTEVILDSIPARDTVTKISFKEQDGTKHYIGTGLMVVDGVEKIEATSSPRRVYIVYPREYHYPYWRNYPTYRYPRTYPKNTPTRSNNRRLR